MYMYIFVIRVPVVSIPSFPNRLSVDLVSFLDKRQTPKLFLLDNPKNVQTNERNKGSQNNWTTSSINLEDCSTISTHLYGQSVLASIPEDVEITGSDAVSREISFSDCFQHQMDPFATRAFIQQEMYGPQSDTAQATENDDDTDDDVNINTNINVNASDKETANNDEKIRDMQHGKLNQMWSQGYPCNRKEKSKFEIVETMTKMNNVTIQLVLLSMAPMPTPDFGDEVYTLVCQLLCHCIQNGGANEMAKEFHEFGVTQ
ncbi:hypothetical protein RFI_07423, partial [Reticulomyxa filosa]